jgi:hypothetical protein
MSDQTIPRMKAIASSGRCDAELRGALEQLVRAEEAFYWQVGTEKSGRGLGGGRSWDEEGLIELIDSDEALDLAAAAYEGQADDAAARADLLASIARSITLRRAYCAPGKI